MSALQRLTIGVEGRIPVSVIVALVVFALCALLAPRFLTIGNLENVVRIAAILFIVSCGQAIVLILGCIEFSFGSSVALASVVTVMSLPAFGPIGAFLCGVAVVLTVGAVNGGLVAYLRLPPVIVTLGTLMIAHGLAASLVGGLPIDAPPSDVFSWPAWGRVLGVGVPIWCAGISLVVLHVLLRRLTFGRQIYLVGANANAASVAGLPVRRVLFSGYVVAAAFAAIAAVILTSRVASGQPNLIPNLPFETIAACAIGGIPLAGGRGRAIEVVAGVLTIAMLNNAVVLLNYPAALQQLLIAVVIIGAVLAPRLNLNVRRLTGAAGTRPAQ